MTMWVHRAVMADRPTAEIGSATARSTLSLDSNIAPVVMLALHETREGTEGES